jgi:hypothetical protein
MNELAARRTCSTTLLARDDQPLIAIFVRENGRDLVRYFVDEEEADANVPPASVQNALRLFRAWSACSAWLYRGRVAY